ncbi:MAG: metal-dependent hydrolase [Caulobacteraceae bacterium]|nr:metal-dependent hydrolase [Caulobacteraceae bacterium]
MTQTPRTPPDLTIQPRDLSFGAKASDRRWWLGDDPVATTFFNALSTTFPHGERFFMDSVRRYRDQVPPTLKAQIAGFLSQEAMHTREHIVFNKQVADHGVDVAALEARVKARLDFARTRPALQQLGATIAMEHFTAILAHALLADPRHMEGASDEAKAMWRWHAIEEVEHKAVAYDTFLAATQNMPGWRRWALRVSTMGASTWILFGTVGRNIADIFTAHGVNRPATWRRLFAYLLIRPGVLRQVLGAYLSYFLPGFHPWNHDDRALAAAAERGLVTAYGGAAS